MSRPNMGKSFVVSTEDIENLGGTTITEEKIYEMISEVLVPFDTRIKALEQKVADLEKPVE